MSLRDGPFGDIRVPLTWSAGAALVIAAIIAAALLLGDRRETMKASAYDTARRAVDAVEGPVGGTISAPIRWTHSGLDFVRGYLGAVSDNRRLRVELAQAQQLRDTLAAVEVENARLKAVLSIRTDPPLPHVAAETIFDSRGPFANTRLANVGRDRGVTEGNPVLSEHGLVGRIVGVSDHVSRVLLLTDPESRTPVLLARTNGRAILSGDGGGSPKLDYIRSAMALKEGDRVLTSGDGGVFPRGLPVGTVVRGFDGGWRVQLDSDSAPIDYVQILLFTDFAQIADEQALAPKDLPTAMTEEPSQSILAPGATNSIAAPAAKSQARAAAKPAASAAPSTTKAGPSPAKAAKPKPAHAKPVAAAPSP
ncbi:MAG TPA: rod shape-determining protein MreC [Caulobacteraceae bacterium]|nr:rod shape-determining protein MreC [Caulobacteraceae bacterium]